MAPGSPALTSSSQSASSPSENGELAQLEVGDSTSRGGSSMLLVFFRVAVILAFKEIEPRASGVGSLGIFFGEQGAAPTELLSLRFLQALVTLVYCGRCGKYTGAAPLVEGSGTTFSRPMASETDPESAQVRRSLGLETFDCGFRTPVMTPPSG